MPPYTRSASAHFVLPNPKIGMAIREGRWDCPQCGAIGHLGRSAQCGTCGAVRSARVRFYLPEDAPEVTDAAQLAAARAGADWLCEHCGSSGGALTAACAQCGAARGASTSQATHDYTSAEIPRAGKQRDPRPLPLTGPRQAARGRGARVPVLLLVALIVGAALVWWRHPYDTDGTVAATAWARTQEVQEYRTLTENGWEVPADGRERSRQRALHHTDHVLDHYEDRTRDVSEQVQTGTRSYTCGSRDLGNGHFEDQTCSEPVYESRTHEESYREPIYRDVPVYATQYAYDIDRWVPAETLRTTGSTAPQWPAFTPAQKRRAGARSEQYTVTFTDGGRTYTQTLPERGWQRYAAGQRVRLKVNRAHRLFAVTQP